MSRKWTEQEIWSWFREHEWISGFNFVPSTPAGGVYALLQEYDHKNAFQEAAKEISLAASLGLNSVRLFLPFELWRQQHDSFMKNLEEFISLLDFYHMTIMPALFNDCTVAKQFYKEPVPGPQPEPVEGFFGGTSDNSFDEETQTGITVGYSITDDEEMTPEIEKYVRELAKRYGQDDRVIIWNIWNELGNSGRGEKSLPMAKKVIGWLREEDVKQPLTIEMWGAQVKGNYYEWLNNPCFHGEVDRENIELSDIITFHFYGDYTHARRMVKFLKQFNRPLINTEWMHRPFQSLIQTHLPLWKREKIGSYFFGLVNGKTQFHIAWDFIKEYPSVDTSVWMHDLYHADFTPYDQEELDILKKCNEDKNIWK